MAEIILSNGMIALVDDEDFERVYQFRWWFNRYVVSKLDGRKNVYMHRFILGINDSSVHVDHRNGDKLDNRKENLRLCNQSQNNANKGKRRVGSSRYKGIQNDGGVWIVWVAGKRVGSFTTEVAAANAYNHYAALKFGEFAKLNNVERLDNWMDYTVKKQRRTSKYRGVNLNKKSGKYQASIFHDGKRVYIGVFNSEEEAAHAYNEMATELLGDKAKLSLISC